MKVGFIGAGGTGKTTLAKVLADKQGLEFMQSPSRDCFQRFGVRREDDQKMLTPAARFQLQMSIFEAIDAQVMGNSDGVFDRTHLDNFAYGSFQCHDVMDNPTFLQMDLTTHAGLGTFDFLFYAPIYDWELPGDLRTNSLAARTMIAAFTRRYLDHHNFKYHVLPDIDVASRLHFCREIMA